MGNCIHKKRGGALSYKDHFAALLPELKAVEDGGKGGGEGGGAIKVHMRQKVCLWLCCCYTQLTLTGNLFSVFPHKVECCPVFFFVVFLKCM